MSLEIWPTGRPRAVVINVMYEQWADGVAPSIGPMGTPLPGGAVDYQAISWARYGRTTGIYHLLELLSEFGVRGSFYASGILTESAPDSLRQIVSAGHELCGHSYSQNIIPASITKEEEQTDIASSLEALEKTTGIRPAGWISPRCTPSQYTSELLAAEGLSWYGDVFDADLPSVEQTQAGPIVALPFGMEVNDLPLFVRYGQPARELAQTFTEILDEHRRSRQKTYLDVTVHAHIGGRPAGLSALRTILTQLKMADDCWIATRNEIAACVE